MYDAVPAVHEYPPRLGKRYGGVGPESTTGVFASLVSSAAITGASLAGVLLTACVAIAPALCYLMAKDEGHGFAKKRNADFQFYATIAFIQEYLLK